jgi:hypothetical protein
MLPFTLEQFIGIFGAYNIGVWPAQVVAYLAGLGMIVLVLRPSKTGDRIVGAALAAMWVWTGVAYHGLYFSAINKAALIFGALFVLQGLVLFHAAVISRHLRLAPRAARRPGLAGLSCSMRPSRTH